MTTSPRLAGSSRLLGVQLQSPVGALAECLLERRAGGEPQHVRRLGGELPVGIVLQVQPGGDAAPGNRSYQVATNSLLLDSIRWKWRTPSTGDGPWTAPPGSQAAASRTTRAPSPARSWLRVIVERPSLTATFPTDQPTGRGARTHGTSDADGTDWASSHNASMSVQSTSVRFSGVLTATSLLRAIATMGPPNTTTSATISASSPTRRALQRWIETGWGGVGSSRVNSPCRSRPWALSIRRSWRAAPAHGRPRTPR